MRFQFLHRLRRAGATPDLLPTEPDPIDHPAISAMSLIELADLPMWTARRDERETLAAAPSRETCKIG